MNNTNLAQICRLCGKPNNCSMALDKNNTACWCTSKATIKALSCPVPEGTYCLCQSCLEKQKDAQV